MENDLVYDLLALYLFSCFLDGTYDISAVERLGVEGFARFIQKDVSKVAEAVSMYRNHQARMNEEASTSSSHGGNKVSSSSVNGRDEASSSSGNGRDEASSSSGNGGNKGKESCANVKDQKSKWIQELEGGDEEDEEVRSMNAAEEELSENIKDLEINQNANNENENGVVNEEIVENQEATMAGNVENPEETPAVIEENVAGSSIHGINEDQESTKNAENDSGNNENENAAVNEEDVKNQEPPIAENAEIHEENPANTEESGAGPSNHGGTEGKESPKIAENASGNPDEKQELIEDATMAENVENQDKTPEKMEEDGAGSPKNADGNPDEEQKLIEDANQEEQNPPAQNVQNRQQPPEPPQDTVISRLLDEAILKRKTIKTPHKRRK